VARLPRAPDRPDRRLAVHAGAPSSPRLYAALGRGHLPAAPPRLGAATCPRRHRELPAVRTMPDMRPGFRENFFPGVYFMHLYDELSSPGIRYSRSWSLTGCGGNTKKRRDPLQMGSLRFLSHRQLSKSRTLRLFAAVTFYRNCRTLRFVRLRGKHAIRPA
jgi:hypothetical protein